MKYSLLLTIMGVCGGFYVHNEQPQLWNQLVSHLQADAPPQVAPILAFVPPDPVPARPNWDWTTSDGKTYRNVVIKKVEADCVTILDEDGGARINTANLPPDIQQLLNYDPTAAGAAAQERNKDDQASALALENERQQVERMKESEMAGAKDAPDVAAGQSPDADGGDGTRVVSGGDSSGYYQNDLYFVMRHVRINPLTGRPEGDPYYVRKYDEDHRALEHHDRIEPEHRGFADNGEKESRSSNGFSLERRPENLQHPVVDSRPAPAPARPSPPPPRSVSSAPPPSPQPFRH